MKTYTYNGTVRTAAGRKLIFPGSTVELPEDDDHVKSLVAQKLLQEVKPMKTKAVEVPDLETQKIKK